MPSIKEAAKPSNAGYVAKIDVDPDGEVVLTPPETPSPEHQFRDVNVAWYGEDRIKITIRGGGPAAIRQAFLTGAGQDVILDLVAVSRGER